jgi:hypothetical protein
MQARFRPEGAAIPLVPASAEHSSHGSVRLLYRSVTLHAILRQSVRYGQIRWLTESALECKNSTTLRWSHARMARL